MKRRLTLLFFLPIFNLTINSQEAEPVNDNAQVIVQTSYESPPIAGKPWPLTLIIDYPDSEQVTVAAPPLGIFTLERSFKSPRLIEDRIQTVVEYRFIPGRTGRFTLEPFMIICPYGVTKTEPLLINITSESPELKPLVIKLVWEGIPSKIETGEHATVSLYSDIQNSQQMPPGFFTPEAPAGLILSSLKLTEQERINGLYAKFDIIPLKDNIYFPSRILQSESTVYEIPALQITVINSAAGNTAGISGEDKAKLQFGGDDFLLSNTTKEYKKARIIRLMYFYSVLFLVIFTIFVCLYLLLKKK
jgi:hypothetical protein